MGGNRSTFRSIALVSASLLLFALAGCGGGGGGGGGGTPASGATPVTEGGLNIIITSATTNGRPVVDFKVTDKTGAAVLGLLPWDLRFNIAKLVPGTNGEPASWQNYLNRAVNGAVEGSEERLAAGFAFGTLLNRGDGTYTYTFATDITNAAANPCPAPCTDAVGKALNISYQPGLTHRITIQHSASPLASGALDFVPSGGAVSARDIVLTATCNQCHAELTAHVTRIDTRLCVSCHNPGSWVAGPPNTTVDFKVMIHKIHYNNAGAALPSVLAGTPYTIGSKDFSDVTFTQDVRNCARCHDGTLSAQGDNWKNRPSMEACGSCHDNVYFGAQPDPARPYQTVAHPGGVLTDNSTCLLCHGPGKVSDVTVAHNLPAQLKAAAAKFKFNIISAAFTAPGETPVVTFSVTDPTNGDQPYDIKADAPFTAGSASTLNVRLGWTQSGIADIGNDGNGQNFGQPIGMNALMTAVAGPNGTYTVTSPVKIPVTQTGTLRVTMDGHPAGDVTTPGTFTDQLRVKSAFRDFAITGTAVARRTVVDIAKCNVCHSVLSLHGNNRTDEPQVCAVCHNPNATDASRRPSSGGVLTGGVDGKLEEAIDFKTMIHGIHSARIVVYGFGGNATDFRDVTYPAPLNNCQACHITPLEDQFPPSFTYSMPVTAAFGTTTDAGASLPDGTDNLRTTKWAATCLACHASPVFNSTADPFRTARNLDHVIVNGGGFGLTQAEIDALNQ
jgi:OmcA/MtrC family decaheme c-type cytochrome